MQGKRILILMTLLFVVPLASGLTIDTIQSSPTGNNQYYIDDFQINVSVDQNSDITMRLFNSGGSVVRGPVERTGVNFTSYSFTNQREGDFSVEIIAVNVNDSNDTSSVNISVKIDNIHPSITANIYGPSNQLVNQTNVTPNGTFLVGAAVEGATSVIVREVSSTTDFPLSEDNEEWESEFIPNDDFGCSTAGQACNLVLIAEDEAGNTANFTDSIDIVELQQQQTQQTFSVDILEPTNDSVVRDSIIPLTIEVDETDIALQRCDYFLRNQDDGSIVTNQGGSVPEEDFTQESQTILRNETYLESVSNGLYTLEVTCHSEDAETVTDSVDFLLEDITSPGVIIDIEEGEANATVYINATAEELRITELVYRDIQDNYYNISHASEYGKSFEFTIDGLEPDTFYVMRVQYEDRDPDPDDDNVDPNLDSETENFHTLGGTDNKTTNQTNVYNALQNMNQTQEEVNASFSGENFSYGRDWFRAGEDIDVLITNFDMNLREFIISVREDIRNVKIDATTSTDTPYWIDDPIPANESVFEYFRIETQNAPDDLLEYVKVRFEVSQNWIEDSNIKPENIVLYRYDSDEEVWNRLPTSLLEEKSLYTQYEALSPGFSLFAVSAEQNPSEPVETSVQEVENKDNETTQDVEKNTKKKNKKNNSAPGTPWYSWILYILGFGVLAYIVYFVASTFITAEESLKDHTVVKAHMKRLESFVDGALEKGYSKEQIKTKLVESGWDEKLVDFVLRRR